jgi:hypothetical protein
MDKQKFIETQIEYIKKIHKLHEKIRHLDESLKELHPIAVVDNNTFFVFDINEYEKQYKFIMEYLSPWELPEEVLAAFPLDFYQNKSTAIISASKLEDPNNYAFVFHEFVHCFVWNKCELSIRKELKIEKQQREANNMIWEMNYQFPYEDDIFINMTTELDDISSYHKEMKKYLNETDFEYMIWQEWKEGFARYVENLVREELKMEKNSNALNPPFDRVCFYEIGSRHIKALIENDKTLNDDMGKLFYRMMLK